MKRKTYMLIGLKLLAYSKGRRYSPNNQNYTGNAMKIKKMAGFAACLFLVCAGMRPSWGNTDVFTALQDAELLAERSKLVRILRAQGLVMMNDKSDPAMPTLDFAKPYQYWYSFDNMGRLATMTQRDQVAWMSRYVHDREDTVEYSYIFMEAVLAPNYKYVDLTLAYGGVASESWLKDKGVKGGKGIIAEKKGVKPEGLDAALSELSAAAKQTIAEAVAAKK